jgi:hypothetical protein
MQIETRYYAFTGRAWVRTPSTSGRTAPEMRSIIRPDAMAPGRQ